VNTIAIENSAVLRLTVNNHAGVLSHICGLFARRAYNIEGLIVLPQGDGAISQMLLLVKEDGKLEQIIRQTQKLVDVLKVNREDASRSLFDNLKLSGCEN